MAMKIFDLFETENVKVEDPGLKRYINFDVKLILKSRGRERKKRFGRGKTNIIERIVNLLQVPGHRGSKHKIMTSQATGKYSKKVKVVIDALKTIQEKTKQNPIQVLIKAIENVAPHDEITVIEYGGARYPQAVDCAPLRRIDLALRNMVHGAYDRAFGKNKSISQTLAEEIEAASMNSNESAAVVKRNETEKQTDSAR